MTERVIMRLTLAVLLVGGVFMGVSLYRKSHQAPAQTMQVTPGGVPIPGVEVKPLTPVGSMAADSLRTHINEINGAYLQLQDAERKAQDLNSEWNLDLPHNQMIHQAPQPAAASAPAKK